MAKISRAQGPSYEEEEREALEYVPAVVRRAEVGPMRRDNGEGDTSSDGISSGVSTEHKVMRGDSETASQSKPVPGTENPSEPTEETASDVGSVDGIPVQTGTAQSSDEGPNAGKSQGEPEPQEKPVARTRPGRKATPAKVAKAKEENDKQAGVRFTDDDF
jgi:hypothetical protein